MRCAKVSTVVAAMGDASAIRSRWRRSGGYKARSRRAQCIYSPKNFFRLDLDGFLCVARSLEGQSAWRASSYM